MGIPRSIFGHSLEWQQAYLTASPEDSAQRDLVAQLALPIGASQTREQAKRVEALQKLIAGITPAAARRMYQRLNGNSDALGQLFHLTLHHTTRKTLLGQLDAKQRDNDRVRLEANAIAERARRVAAGEADAKKIAADAEAQSIREVTKALAEAQQNPLLYQLRGLEVERARVERWNGSYPSWLMTNAANTPPNLMLQMPAPPK